MFHKVGPRLVQRSGPLTDAMPRSFSQPRASKPEDGTSCPRASSSRCRCQSCSVWLGKLLGGCSAVCRVGLIQGSFCRKSGLDRKDKQCSCDETAIPMTVTYTIRGQRGVWSKLTRQRAASEADTQGFAASLSQDIVRGQRSRSPARAAHALNVSLHDKPPPSAWAADAPSRSKGRWETRQHFIERAVIFLRSGRQRGDDFSLPRGRPYVEWVHAASERVRVPAMQGGGR